MRVVFRLSDNPNIVDSYSLSNTLKLPDGIHWKYCSFNEKGKEIKRKDLPKEEYFTDLPWSIQDRWGNRHSWVNSIKRERYQRDYVEPFNVKIKYDKIDWENCVSSNELIVESKNYEKIKNTVNMFLEMFGSCYIIWSKDNHFRKQLNYKILPEWEDPRTKLKSAIENRHSGKEKDRWLLLWRMDYIEKFSPNFHAIGVGWMDGYYIVWFKNQNIYIAESIKYWNATYVFDNHWDKVVALSKKEILNWWLTKWRIIHNSNRKNKVRKLLSNFGK